MNDFFGRDFSGGPFVLFAFSHWVAITAILLLNLIIIRLVRRPDRRWTAPLRYGMAAALLINEALWHIWNAVTGQWTVQTMLPLHLCSVLVFLSAYMLIRRSYSIYEFAYFLGIGGAIQAILTPDLGIYDFPHFRYYQTFISHGLIVTAAVYMTLIERMRPTWRSFRRVLLWGNAYLLFVAAVNVLLGSNYMFIARKPETASLIDLLGPWPWYILSLEAVAFAVFLLLYLPFALRDLASRRAVRPVAGDAF